MKFIIANKKFQLLLLPWLPASEYRQLSMVACFFSSSCNVWIPFCSQNHDLDFNVCLQVPVILPSTPTAAAHKLFHLSKPKCPSVNCFFRYCMKPTLKHTLFPSWMRTASPKHQQLSILHYSPHQWITSRIFVSILLFGRVGFESMITG